MPAIDPSLNLTGTLTALQQTQSTGGDGSENLVRAARSLESVQGNVAGQTMAIQTMAMASQQQMTTLQMLISQLSMQLSTFSQSVNQLSSSMTVTSARAPLAAMSMPAPMAMTPTQPFLPRMAQGAMGAAGTAMTLGGGALRGLSYLGQPMGRAAESVVSPMFGTPVFGAAPGMFGPQLGPNVGFMRGMAMAGGVGITPEMMRTAGGGQLREMGAERAQQRFGDAALGLIGGGARLATDLGVGAIGMGAASAMGLGLAGSMAVGGLAIPAALAAAPVAAINETMNQTAAMRGFGDQYARNAFRFQGPAGAGGAMRRPGMQQRLGVGQAINRMEIQDLTLNEQDMREAFAGTMQQDLMRGVRNVDEVVNRFRETKETLKLIGRRMGQGLQEASGTLGALQGLGFDPQGTRTRATIFGASSIMGLTPGEALQRGAGFAGQYTGQGYGQGMMGISLASQQAAQSAIQSGAMSNEQIAAFGGREGAGGAMANLFGAYMQGPLGKATLMAGARPGGWSAAGLGGMGVQQMITQAGARGAQDVNARIDIALGGEKQMRDFLRNPNRAMDFMLDGIFDMAKQYESTGASPENALRLAISTTAKRNNMGDLSGEQINGIVSQIKDLPKARRQQAMQMAQQATDEAESSALSAGLPWARAKRWGSRQITPAAEAMTGMTAAAGTRFERAGTALSRAWTGTESMYMGREADVDAITELRARGRGEAGFREEMMPLLQGGGQGIDNINRQRTAENARRQERNAAREAQDKISSPGIKVTGAAKQMADTGVKNALTNPETRKEMADLKEQLQDPKADKRAIMNRMLDLASGGTYKDLKSSKKGDAMVMRAYQDAVERETGASAGAIFSGRETQQGALTDVERQKMKTLTGEVTDLFDLESDQAKMLAQPEIVEYLKAFETGSMNEDIERRASEAGGEAFAKLKANLEKGTEAEAAYGIVGLGGIYSAQERAQKLLGAIEGDEGLMKLSGREAAQNRIREVIGKGVSGTLADLRKRKGFEGAFAGISGQLTGGSPEQTLKALGRLPAEVTDEQLAELEKVEGGEQLAKTIRGLRGIDLAAGEGGERLSDAEKAQIAGVLGEKNVNSERMKKIYADVNAAGDLGTVMASALDVRTQPTNMTGLKGQGLTDEGARIMNNLYDSTRGLMESVDALEKRVKKIGG